MSLQLPADFESFCYGMAVTTTIIIAYTSYILYHYELVLFPKYKQVD